jgi:tellurite resistance protein TerC
MRRDSCLPVTPCLTQEPEYFAGYIVEKSLSVDNLFVFVIIITTFAVPAAHQQRVLNIGILAALILRAIFIALGAALVSAFSFMFLLFGLLLIVTAVQLFPHRNEDPSIEDNGLVRLTRRVVPVTEEYHGGRLFTRVDRRLVATPLFIVLIAIGSTDILFALDSIPAVFGVTDEAFIVFAATLSRCWACAPCTFSFQGCWTGSSTSRPVCR